MKWTGNITLKMDDKEDTYSPGTIEVEKYSEAGIALTFVSKEGRGKAVIRLSPEEFIELIECCNAIYQLC